MYEIGVRAMRRRWDLSEAARQVIAFRDERDWTQFHRPKELAAGLAIEAAELQQLFLWREGEDATSVSADEERMDQIREEIADVAVFLLMLAHDLKVDLASAIAEKLDANARRYPAREYRASAKKAPRACRG